MNEPRKVLPAEKEIIYLRLLCTYLLYDRAQETELRMAFESLVTERHAKFHNAEVGWADCRNQVCVHARLISAAARAPEVVLNTFAIELMQAYGVNFTPDGDRAIYAKLVKKEEAERIIQAGGAVEA